MKLKLIGTPPKSVIEWLCEFAKDNEIAAQDAFFFWNKMRYRGQAWAFRSAADLIAQAIEE